MPSPHRNQASTPVFTFTSSGGGLHLEDNDSGPFSKSRELLYETRLLSRTKFNYHCEAVQTPSTQHAERSENAIPADPSRSTPQSLSVRTSGWTFRDVEVAFANSRVYNLPPFRGMIAYLCRGFPLTHSDEDGFRPADDEDVGVWPAPEAVED